jgi:acyl phosphate:glycerol-3-phosphate acyltransferase
MVTGLFILIAYLIGSVSFAVVVTKLMGLPDPRTYGSNNPGATNVLRSGNKKAAILTLIGDAAKGWVAVMLAKYFAPQFGLGENAIAAVGLAALIGHLWPVYHGFKGGKGVATAWGILLALQFGLGMGVLFIWVLMAYFSRISSLSSMAAAAAAPLFAANYFGFSWTTLSALIMAVLVIARHHENIKKLLAGNESYFGQSKSDQ